MSVEAVSWALRVPVGGSAKVVLLGLANHAHPDGSESYPMLDTLAVYACCDRSTVKRNLRKLESDGWAIADGKGPKGQNKYRLPLRQGGQIAPGQDAGGARVHPLGGAPVHPEPSFNQLRVKSGGAGASLVKIGGKPVDALTWQRTTIALEEFNRQTGKSLGALTGSGQPSEAARRVYSRLREWPALATTDVADLIERTLRSRWWGTGEPSIGVVFGPKVFEDNMTRSGEPTSTREIAAQEKRDRNHRRGDALRRLAKERGVQI